MTNITVSDCASFAKQILPKFGKHFLIIGIIGGTIATAVECNERYSGIAGFVYGIIPVTFIYLYAVAIKYHSIENADDMSKTTLMGGILWLIYIGLCLICSQYISKKFCSDNSTVCKTKRASFNLIVPFGITALFTVGTIMCIKKYRPILLNFK